VEKYNTKSELNDGICWKMKRVSMG